MATKYTLSYEITADPAKLKAGLALSRREILSTYADLKNGLGEANKKLLEAQAAAQGLGRELGRTGPPTKAMLADFERARVAVVKAKEAVEAKTAALQRSRAAAQANATALAAAAQAETASAAAAQRRALMTGSSPSSGASTASMVAVGAAARLATTDVAALQRGVAGVAATAPALGAVSGQMRAISTGIASIGAAVLAGVGINQLLRLSDGYTAVNSQLKVYAESSADLANSQKEVFGISQAYGRELGSTAVLLGRLVQPLRDMGREGGDAVKITEAVSASLRIAGATAAESASAQIQFSQAIAANTLQGEELNSVLEASPPLARALAAAMRVSVGDLKKMGAEGKLTGQIIADALLSQYDALRERGLRMENTLGESLTRIQNAFMRSFGERTTSGAGAVADGLTVIAQNMSTVVDVAALAGSALAVAFGARLLTSLAAAVVAKQALIAAERQTAVAALATAQANVRAAQTEAARTLTTKGLAAAQLQLAAAEKAAAVAAGGFAARAGGALLGLLGGPIGAIASALMLGVTAWQLWGNRAETATGQATKSLSELVKELQDFGANMSVVEKTKHFEAMAVAIKKAREEEALLRRASDERAEFARVAGQLEPDEDPALAAKRAERVAAEKALQDELTAINKRATTERQFLVKALVEKQKALNGELVIDEKKALAERQADNVKAAEAVRAAWLSTLDQIKAKQAEAAAAPGKAADRSASLRGRIDQVRIGGMSEEEKAVYQAQQAQAAGQEAAANRMRASFELTKAYSQQLRGELDAAKKSFDTAEKDLQRAFDQAEKAGDVGLMDEIANRLVDIEKQRGQIAAGEVMQLEQQAEAQRAKMTELEAAAEALKKKLAGMEVDVKIDAAVAKIKTLQDEAAKLQALLAGAAAGVPQPNGTVPDAIPARAFGGPLPGYASHDRADNMIYRGTPGEWVIQRPAVRYWGPAFMAAINAMRLPKFAFGGQLGASSAVSNLRVPSISAGRAMGGGDPAIFDLGALGRIRAQSTGATAGDVEAVIKRAALRFGRR